MPARKDLPGTLITAIKLIVGYREKVYYPDSPCFLPVTIFGSLPMCCWGFF
jgi:hypothetical protein